MMDCFIFIYKKYKVQSHLHVLEKLFIFRYVCEYYKKPLLLLVFPEMNLHQSPYLDAKDFTTEKQ